MRADQLALQLYTVRAACAQDFLATLREVAAMGYPAVEFAGLHGHAPATVRAALDELGLRAVSAHVGLDRFENDLPGVIAELKTLGCSYAAVPHVGDAWRSAEGVAALCERLNRWGAAFHAEGLSLHYHNHEFEFSPLGETSMWETIVATTDPAHVGMELDVFWAAFAGHDPAALLARHAGRIGLVHLKDMAADGKSYTTPGTGTLNWDAILPAAAAAGAQWYITEHDNPPDPLADARQAYALMAAKAQQA